MSELRQQFTISIIENLKQLRTDISSVKEISGTFLQEVFRQIHTVKGTAQTFGFEQSSRLAHEMENLLVAVKNEQSVIDKQLLLESIAELESSFEETSTETPGALFEKIKTAVSSKTTSVQILPGLPEDVLKLLSNSETKSLSAAFRSGKHIYCLEVYFTRTNFREKLLSFRQIPEQNGEIIATLSASKKDSQIGFRFLTAGKIDAENLQELTRDFSPEIVFEISRDENNLLKTLEEIAAHGEKLADQFGKKIGFEFFAVEVSLSDDQLQMIFDTLLHLTRNAVDHAIEIPAGRIKRNKRETGKIEIRFSRENGNLKIIVADDGKGIDVEKVRSKAVNKKLFTEYEIPDERAVLDLIFLPEFSTAEKLTEISGRGVGLDAVRKSIENAGGEIKVESRKEDGTVFEVILPLKD